jgi:hypothetical protein
MYADDTLKVAGEAIANKNLSVPTFFENAAKADIISSAVKLPAVKTVLGSVFEGQNLRKIALSFCYERIVGLGSIPQRFETLRAETEEFQNSIDQFKSLIDAFELNFPDLKDTLSQQLEELWDNIQNGNVTNDNFEAEKLKIVDQISARLSQGNKSSALDLDLVGRVVGDVAMGTTAAEETLLPVREALELPTEAPMRWQDRDKKDGENPVSFISRVYAKWVGKGLERGHIRHLDDKLYTALANWQRQGGKIPQDMIPNTKQRWGNATISESDWKSYKKINALRTR